MPLIKYIVLLFSSCILYINASSVDYDGWMNIQMLHALDINSPDSFTERGNISIRSIITGASVVHQNTLSQSDQIQLKNLANKNKPYRMKVIVEGVEGSRRSFITGVKACALLSVQLSDTITLYLDHQGNAMGVSQTVWNSQDTSCEDLIDETDEFNTDVYVKHMEAAPSPDTHSYIQKLEKERESRERGEVKDNRSFISKYWMYIVPVAIFVLISGAANPEAGGGGGR